MEVDYKIIAISIIALAMVYTGFIRPYLVKRNLLTKEMLELIDYACERGVGYAEQLYKSDQSIDRQKIALDFAFDVVRKAGIVPEKYLDIIRGIIEDKVRQLPKTHDENGDIII
ncbi:MAG: hypothetical protein PWQ96_74 [Clostridia bacterium]|jgi:hypothetical protein|nr:hypothetical protein [Clostridiales bacterium]MDK2984432.1 hypothetical protein [Clostridia bacterium]